MSEIPDPGTVVVDHEYPACVCGSTVIWYYGQWRRCPQCGEVGVVGDLSPDVVVRYAKRDVR